MIFLHFDRLLSFLVQFIFFTVTKEALSVFVHFKNKTKPTQTRFTGPARSNANDQVRRWDENPSKKKAKKFYKEIEQRAFLFRHCDSNFPTFPVLGFLFMATQSSVQTNLFPSPSTSSSTFLLPRFLHSFVNYTKWGIPRRDSLLHCFPVILKEMSFPGEISTSWFIYYLFFIGIFSL